MTAWSQLWHQFIATLTAQPVAEVLAVWVGLALILVMALEGLLLNLFPALVFQRYLEKMPERKRKSAEPVPAPQQPPRPPVFAAPPEIPAAPPVSEQIASAPPPEPAAKLRRSKNRKKPSPGPKTARAASGWRRATPPGERLSRGTHRLLAPKN